MQGTVKCCVWQLSRPIAAIVIGLAASRDVALAVANHSPTAGFGTALRFDGADDYVEIADADALDLTGNYTLECWFKADRLDDRFGLVSKYQSTFADGWSLFLNDTDLAIDGMQTRGLKLQTGRWHHVAAVNNGGLRTLYLDGVARALSGTPLAVKANSNPVRLGSHFGGYHFAGSLDEVRLWKAALPANVISNWMYREIDGTHPARSDLVACYKLNEGAGAAAGDSAGTHAGTLRNMSGAAWGESQAGLHHSVLAGHNLRGPLPASDEDGASHDGADWSLSLDVVTPPTYGTATAGPDNTFSYFVPRVTNTLDSFTYQVRDASNAVSSVATVWVAIVAPPAVDITNDNATVSASTEYCSIGGTLAADIIGTLWWTNSLTGGSGTLAATTPWLATGIALGFGDNPITMTGTNAAGMATNDNVTLTRAMPPVTYVATGGANVWPYRTLADASTTIQPAVDAVAAGGTVWVGDGTYDTGGATANGMSNRVCITANIDVRSVNGPSNTILVGAGPRGPGAVRCVYMSAGCLSGFTLTNGNTCTSGNWATAESGGGAMLSGGGTLSNCVVTGCSAYDGGGGVFCYYGGVLSDCTLSGNSCYNGDATAGGGAVWCYRGGTLSGCTLSGNRSNSSSENGGMGGGVALDYGGTLNNCSLSGNWASNDGGGVSCIEGGTLNTCTIRSNTANVSNGGGVYCERGGTLKSCAISGNSAGYKGGGAYLTGGGTLNNCTLSANTAPGWNYGDGVYSQWAGNLENCIVFGNGGAEWNGDFAAIRYTCAPGLSGNGNVDANPQFVNAPAGNYRLAVSSPCIGAGTNQTWMAGATDLGGHARVIGATVDMGAYEYALPAVTITDAPASVPYSQATAVVGGTNNPFVVGTMWYTNAANGVTGSLAAQPAWTTPPLALSLGPNPVTVTGTNRDGVAASDSVVITRETAPPGNAFAFDGASHSANVGHGASFALGNTLTVEAWIRPSGLDARRGVFSTRRTNAPGAFQMEVGPGSGGANRVAVSGVNTWVAQTGDGALQPDRWNHIAYTRSGAGAGTHALYVNGVAQTLISDADYTFVDNSSDKVLGGGTSGGQLFAGRLDDVRVWNVARTETQIRDAMHRELGGDEPGLVAYYRFNETAGTGLADTTGNGNDGALSGTPAWVASAYPCAVRLAGQSNVRGVWDAWTESLDSGRLGVVASSTADPDFAVFGHDGGADGWQSGDMPPGAVRRLARVWQVESAGTVSGQVAFAVAGLDGDFGDGSNLRLLADDDGDFADATGHTGALDGDTFTVPAHGLQDGAFYTLAELCRLWFVDGAASAGGDGLSWDTAFRTVQEALSAANHGDSILVKYGVYGVTQSLALGGRDVRLSSDDGTHTNWNDAAWSREACVLDGQQACRLLTIRGSVTSRTVIRGFTFRNGRATSESAIARYGGGIYLGGGACPVIQGCAVSNCVATTNGSGYGGGICVNEEGTRPVILDTLIVGNVAAQLGGMDSGVGYGGGIDVFMGAAPALSNLVVHGNTARGVGGYGRSYGGGLCLHGTGATGTVTDCVISGNIAGAGVADAFGGGLYVVNHSLLLAGCDIRDNRAQSGGAGYGGGIRLEYAPGSVIENTLVRGNLAAQGGGAGLKLTDAALRHTVFYANGAAQGAGLYRTNGVVTVENCVFAAHTAGDGRGIHSVQPGFVVSHACLFGNTGPNWNVVADQCVTTDPRFVAAAAGDFRLLYGSSCIDTGATLAAATRDRAGRPRPLGTASDIGAYEYDRQTADSDGDTMPDGWEADHLLNPLLDDAAGNLDNDPFDNGQEHVADTDPTNPVSYFRITAVSNLPPWTVYFEASAGRAYTLIGVSNLSSSAWLPVPGAGPRLGTGGADALSDTNVPPKGPFYKLQVELP